MRESHLSKQGHESSRAAFLRLDACACARACEKQPQREDAALCRLREKTERSNKRVLDDGEASESLASAGVRSARRGAAVAASRSSGNGPAQALSAQTLAPVALNRTLSLPQAFLPRPQSSLSTMQQRGRSTTLGHEPPYLPWSLVGAADRRCPHKQVAFFHWRGTGAKMSVKRAKKRSQRARLTPSGGEFLMPRRSLIKRSIAAEEPVGLLIEQTRRMQKSTTNNKARSNVQVAQHTLRPSKGSPASSSGTVKFCVACRSMAFVARHSTSLAPAHSSFPLFSRPFCLHRVASLETGGRACFFLCALS